MTFISTCEVKCGEAQGYLIRNPASLLSTWQFSYVACLREYGPLCAGHDFLLKRRTFCNSASDVHGSGPLRAKMGDS